mgnify:CR=1 FL=1
MDSKVTLAPFTSFSKVAPLKILFFWCALTPQIAMLFLSGSYKSLALVLAAVLGALASEASSLTKKNGKSLSAAYALLAGTIIGLFFPPDFPAASAFLITFFFLFMSKSIFGSSGSSWLNPIAIAVMGAWFAGQSFFGSFTVFGADLLAKNPSLNLIDGALLTNGADEKITLFLNDTVFSLFGVSIPNGYVSLFWDNHAAIPAFRFTFWTLAASIFFIAFDYASARIPCVFLLVYGLLVRFASPLWTGGGARDGDLLLAFLSSGILFAAFFLIQWPGTVPCSDWAKILYAAIGGVLAFVFCGTGTSPIGAVATVLFMNIISPAIQEAESRSVRKKLSALLADKLGEGER